MSLRQPVGMREIARAADVSIATVSMALANHPNVSEATRQRVRECCRQLGYRRLRRRHASAAAATRTAFRNLGFLVLGNSLEDEVPLAHLHVINVRATEGHWHLSVKGIEKADDPRVIDQVAAFAQPLDGVIATGMITPEILALFEQLKLPHVILGRCTEDFKQAGSGRGQVVSCDEEGMGDLSARLLMALGHKRIGFVCERAPTGLWAARWLRGFQLAHLHHHAELDPAHVQITGRVFAGGRPAAEAFLAMEKRPTGFVVPDARIASSFLHAMRAEGVALSKQSLVVSGHFHLLTAYGLEEFPWIGNDVNDMTHIAVHQIQALAQRELPCPTEIIVPHAIRNVPVELLRSVQAA